MPCTYLVHRKSGYSFLFRSIIPTDLQPQLGRRQFQLSLKCGIRHQAKFLALHLYNLTQQIYASIRQNPAKKQLTPEQIKEMLKLELGNTYRSNQAITANQKLVEMADITTSTTEEANNKISLAELSQRYLQAKNEAGYPSKTIKGYSDSHRLMLEVIGNRVVDSLTHEDGRKLVETIKKLPANRSKSYPKLTIEQLLQLKGVKLLSFKTTLKHVERASSLINWAIKQGYTQQNVFRGKLEPSRKAEVVEKHFTHQELKLILEHQLKEESLLQNKPDRYWVTLLSAYSGARLNEICQLNVSDIQQADGIWLMNLTNNTEDKNIKTPAGNRTVPLHPKILQLGFLDYVEMIKNEKQRKLFPQLKKMESTGFGTRISHWFARYLTKLGIKKKGKNFHSFRHIVVNKLTCQKVYEPFIKELIGHAHRSLTMDVYAGKKPVDVLLNECVIMI
ncbi:MAG: site-specific integrase [Candidatus Poribacteria bacterium]|jgi:integrase|nr:site-specific integrase [Candidatus Poribacteria bacterium]MDP6745654.1 site-specific integrase [Candidatus Poribacteria bacterium]MDP6997413.1 site-specific integrase [Candidatus Poribacteria bacterium]